MNYYGSNETDSYNGKVHKGRVPHMFWMILCCAIPLVLLFTLPFFKIQNETLNSVLRTAIALACPLIMVFMMMPMSRNNENIENEHHSNTKQIER